MNPTQTVEAVLTLGGVAVIILVLLLFIWAWRRTNGGLMDPQTPDNRVTSPTWFVYPYIRGSDRYRRSLVHCNDTVQVRLAMGLPPQHDESMWRDSPAQFASTDMEIGETIRNGTGGENIICSSLVTCDFIPSASA